MLRWAPRSRTLSTTEVVAGVGKGSGEAAGGAVRPAVPSKCQLSPSSQCDTGCLTVCLSFPICTTRWPTSYSSQIFLIPVSESCSVMSDSATPWTVACQAPLSMGFSRQEYWNGLPCPPPGDLPDPGIEPASHVSLALAGRFFTTSATWEEGAFLLFSRKTWITSK